MKDIIYYTDNRINEPIFSIVQKQLNVGLPIISVSLKPINFGENIALPLEPSYLTMITQIYYGLKASKADSVFFCEHDVLYPKCHFDFTPPKDDIFYYNSHVWRWDYPKDRAITYDRLISLSGLCANRNFVLDHYEKRLTMIRQNGWDEDKRHEPEWARLMGYEPGTKKKKRGGYFDDDFDIWKSEYPMVDIRHGKTFSQSKVTLESFKHLPSNWQETTIDKIRGWNLKELFNLK